jgi:hypothetical protein
MAGLVGVILVGMALFSIVGVMFMIVREKHEHEEWYQPGNTAAAAPGVTPAAPVAPVIPPAKTEAEAPKE